MTIHEHNTEAILAQALADRNTLIIQQAQALREQGEKIKSLEEKVASLIRGMEGSEQ